jgi:hypothetical protein
MSLHSNAFDFQAENSVFRLKATPCTRDAFLLRRGLRELAELATQLHADGALPFDILLDVGRLACQLRATGSPLPPAAALATVRALLGLDRFDPMEAWQARLTDADPQALADGIGMPFDEECERRRRAGVLARWILANANKPIVDEIVQAALAIAPRYAGEGGENV